MRDVSNSGLGNKHLEDKFKVTTNMVKEYFLMPLLDSIRCACQCSSSEYKPFAVCHEVAWSQARGKGKSDQVQQVRSLLRDYASFISHRREKGRGFFLIFCPSTNASFSRHVFLGPTAQSPMLFVLFQWQWKSQKSRWAKSRHAGSFKDTQSTASGLTWASQCKFLQAIF
jgi:hypothetical protein